MRLFSEAEVLEITCDLLDTWSLGDISCKFRIWSIETLGVCGKFLIVATTLVSLLPHRRSSLSLIMFRGLIYEIRRHFLLIRSGDDRGLIVA